MVKTLEYAQSKWESKTAKKGAKWKRETLAEVDTYAKHMAEFLGLPKISEEKYNAYKSGIERVTPEDFENALKGKGEKYARKLKEAFTPITSA